MQTPLVFYRELPRKQISAHAQSVTVSGLSNRSFLSSILPYRVHRSAYCFAGAVVVGAVVFVRLLVVATACEKNDTVCEAKKNVNLTRKKCTPLKWVCINVVNNTFNSQH